MAGEKDENFDVETFFNDPKHAREADIMRKSIRKVIAEIATEEEAAKKKEEEEAAKNKKPSGLLDFLFGDKK